MKVIIKLHLRFELSHGLDRVLYWCLKVDAMAVEEVNGRYTKPHQTLLARFFDVLWIAAEVVVIRRAHTRELRCEKDFLALSGAFEPLAKQVLAVALAWT